MPEEETEETGGYREPGAFPKAQKAPDGIACPQWCGAGLLHQLESPQGIQQFPDISGHTFSHQEAHPGHTQGTSRQWATESRCLPTGQTTPMGPEHPGSEHEPWFVSPSRSIPHPSAPHLPCRAAEDKSKGSTLNDGVGYYCSHGSPGN